MTPSPPVPDFAILLTAANRCLTDRLGEAVAQIGGGAMRPSFGFVLRAVAAEEPTVSRLAALLGVTKQAASRTVDDMVTAGFLARDEDPADRRRTRLRLTEQGRAIRERALTESRDMEAELRDTLGDVAVTNFRAVLVDFVNRHGGGEEIAALRSRAPSETH